MRLTTILTIALIGVIMLSLTTCTKKDTTPAPDQIVIAENVKVIDSQTWNNCFQSMDTSNYTLTFSRGIKKFIKSGDVIVSFGSTMLTSRSLSRASFTVMPVYADS